MLKQQCQPDPHVFAGTLHSGSYPDTLAFLRSLASLHSLTSAASSSDVDAADREAAAELFDWQVCVIQRWSVLAALYQVQSMLFVVIN